MSSSVEAKDYWLQDGMRQSMYLMYIFHESVLNWIKVLCNLKQKALKLFQRCPDEENNWASLEFKLKYFFKDFKSFFFVIIGLLNQDKRKHDEISSQTKHIYNEIVSIYGYKCLLLFM